MKIFCTTLTLLITCLAWGQSYLYEASEAYPYGRPNPDAPKEVTDYAKLIGTCDCKSVSRISRTEWADTVSMIWTFKYIMNGWGVQDMTLKGDGKHSGSIRQFNADSSKWYVHYYTGPSAVPMLPSWEGTTKTEDGSLVLYRENAAPNGMEGFFRLTFSNISDDGFHWAGEWVDKAETIVYPTWRIVCKKRK